MFRYTGIPSNTSSISEASWDDPRWRIIDLFTDTVAILISIVSNSYYGMPRGQIHINLPPEHPIMSFETIEIKMATVSAKRSIARTSNNQSIFDSADEKKKDCYNGTVLQK